MAPLRGKNKFFDESSFTKPVLLIYFVWLQRQKCAGSGAPRFPTTVTFCHNRERADASWMDVAGRVGYHIYIHAPFCFAKEYPHIIT